MTARHTADYCDCLLSAHLDLLSPATPSRRHRAARVSPPVITWGGGGDWGPEESFITGVLEGGEVRGWEPSLLQGRAFFITRILVRQEKGSSGLYEGERRLRMGG